MLRLVEGVDTTSPLAGVDHGIARETRVQPCTRDTWCIEHDGHAGGCTRKEGHTLYEPLEHERTRNQP